MEEKFVLIPESGEPVPGETDEIGRMMGLLDGHFQYKPGIYYLDLVLCAFFGYGGALLFLTTPWSHPFQEALWAGVGAAGLFRMGCFIHEIAHMPKSVLKGFKFLWNVVAGVPLGIPSFLYMNHVYHHSAKTYGTPGDGEYLPLRQDSGWKVALSLCQIPLTLALIQFRFLVLVPLTLLVPGGRRWLLRNVSSYTMVPIFQYEKERRAEGWWLAADLATSAWLWGMALAFWTGTLPAVYALKIQVLVVLGLGFNGFRNLFAHTYRSGGEPMDHWAQFHDSITITAPWPVEAVFFPVGLKYHALHHLFPSLPYHELKKVHELFLERLPENSPYRRNAPRALGATLEQLFFPSRP